MGDRNDVGLSRDIVLFTLAAPPQCSFRMPQSGQAYNRDNATNLTPSVLRAVCASHDTTPCRSGLPCPLDPIQ